MSRTDDNRLLPMWGQLAKALGIQELPEPVKDQLLRHYETEINLAIGTEEQDDFEQLIRLAKSMYDLYILPPPNRQRRTSTFDKDETITTPKFGPYESLRAEVLSEYLAKLAAFNPEVVRFRNDVLTGELLTAEQAYAFLSSPATRYLELGVWRAYGIPATHTATLLDQDRGHTEDGPFHWVRLRTDPPGEEHAVFVPNPEGYDSLYVTEDGRNRRITFWHGSVLGYLRQLCKKLTEGHPWDIDQATWFVLTGESSSVRPITARKQETWHGDGRAYTAIFLTVQPWVSPETVEMVYRQAQKQVIGGRPGRIGDKNLNLLRFVTGRADANGNVSKGAVLVRDWDGLWKEKRPQWCYGSDTRRFWRDFRKVQESVTNSKRAGLFLEPGQYVPEEYVQETS